MTESEKKKSVMYISMVDVVEVREQPFVKWGDRMQEEHTRERGKRRMKRLGYARKDCKIRKN